jgi:AraC-like DNA-binding protein
MEFSGRPAPGDLAPFVRSLWFVRGAPVRPYERILPQAVAHLIINLSDPYRLLTRGGEVVGEPFTGAFLSGLQQEYLVIENPATLWQCGAELTPAGLAAFTETPLVELSDRVQDAAPVIAGSASWREQLRATATAEETLDLLEHLLRSARRPGFAIETLVSDAVSRLDGDPDIPIHRLALELGLSDAALIALFKRGVGSTPKAYADLMRFVGFLASIPFDGPPPRWSELVAGTGYYDQAHFIRSFKRYAGVTPSQYLEGILEFGAEYRSFLPMDEISDNLAELIGR